MVRELAHGWISQPNGRGTIDIIQSCGLTISLCSWSVLFLNLAKEHRQIPKRINFLLNKAKWMVFCIYFPEVVTGIATEQWRSARQSVEDFESLRQQWALAPADVSRPDIQPSNFETNLHRIEICPWTMRHAFFADMGGVLLACSDYTPFPIDSHQLCYLVKHKHMAYPSIDERTIWDKNKADGFARAITILQMSWFSIQAIARCVLHLPLSTFELSTLAFIFCTVLSFFFWQHKPLDVDTPIVLTCPTPLAHILSAAQDEAEWMWRETPLDFVQLSQSNPGVAFIPPFWYGVRKAFGIPLKRKTLPVRTFGNSRTTPPHGLKKLDKWFFNFMPVAYFGIYLAGWNFTFPSHTEQLLWRCSSLVMEGVLVFYLLLVLLVSVIAAPVARKVFGRDDIHSLMQFADLLPQWALLGLVYWPFITTYFLARTYIIVEGFVNLRALPVECFTSINWSNFIPHF